MEIGYLPDRLQRALSDAIRPDERIGWIGRPGPKPFGWQDWLIVTFAVEWLALCVVWLAGAVVLVLNGGMQGNNPLWSPICFPLFGVPFLLLGIRMLRTPWRTRRRLRNTVYVLTDQRAVILECGWWREHAQSFTPEQLSTAAVRNEKADGSGDLIVSETESVDEDGYRRTKHIGFFAIGGVRRVKEQIDTLVQSSVPRSSPSRG